VANERLRSCITGARLTISDVAAQVGVDPKTVERWIVLGRVPHRSHRWATASLLGTDEAYLWPEIADHKRTQAASVAELITLYPNRGVVPAALWRGLLDGAADRIDVLVLPGCSCQTDTRRSPSCLFLGPSKEPRCGLPWEIRTPRRCAGEATRNASEMDWPPECD